MSLELFWIILLVLIALCLGFLIPLLWQLRRTAARTENFLAETQNELTPLLKDLRDTSERAARLAQQAEEDVTRLAPLFKSLGEAGQSLHALTGSLNSDLFRYAGSALGFWLGMRSTQKRATPQDPPEKGE